MRDHKVWNSDLGRIFIEGYDKIEKSYCPHCHKDKESCQCGKLDFKDQSAIEAEKNIKKEEGFFKPIYQYGKAPEPGSKAYEAQFDKAKYDEYQTKEQRTLGKGGQAIGKMLNGPINKDFDGMVKSEKPYNSHEYRRKRFPRGETPKDTKMQKPTITDKRVIGKLIEENKTKASSSLDRPVQGRSWKSRNLIDPEQHNYRTTTERLSKASPNEIIAANTQVNELYRKIKSLRTKLSSDPGVKSELDKLTTQHNDAVQKRDKMVGFTKSNE